MVPAEEQMGWKWVLMNFTGVTQFLPVSPTMVPQPNGEKLLFRLRAKENSEGKDNHR